MDEKLEEKRKQCKAEIAALCEKDPKLKEINDTIEKMDERSQLNFITIATIVQSSTLPKGQFLDIVKAAVRLVALTESAHTLEMVAGLFEGAPEGAEKAIEKVLLPYARVRCDASLQKAKERLALLLEVLWEDKLERNKAND